MANIGKIVLLAAIVGLSLVVFGGFKEDGYLKYVEHMPDPQPYPFSGVAVCSAIVLVECFALFAVFRYSNIVSLAGRFLMSLFLFTGLTALFAFGSMHQAPYYSGHLLWLLIVVVFLFVGLVVSIIRSFVARA